MKIYLINGGGQQVRQDVQSGKPTKIQIVMDSDWPEKSGVVGQDFFTGAMWHKDLETLKANAEEWADGLGEVEFEFEYESAE